MDLLPAEERSAYEAAAQLHGDGWRIPPPFHNDGPGEQSTLSGAGHVSRRKVRPVAALGHATMPQP
jgi:hypothetical protein